MHHIHAAADRALVKMETTLEEKAVERSNTSQINDELNRCAEILINLALKRHGILDISSLTPRDYEYARKNDPEYRKYFPERK